MKYFRFLIFVLVLLLTACSNDKAEQPSTPTDPPSTNSENNSNEEDDSSNSTDEPNYFGYTPDDDLEKKYFDYISKMPNWESYEYTFMYDEQRWGDDDMELEINDFTKIVVAPFQLYRDYSSTYFSNTMYELYVNEEEGYENSMMDGWQKIEDPKSYNVNLTPSRAELLFALIDSAEELYEIDTNLVTFEVTKNQDELAYKTWLSYFHNIFDEKEAKANNLEELYTDLEDLEGFSVEIETDGEHIIGIDILISFNRLDPDSVDQLHYNEKFTNINSFKSIEIPAEVREQ